MFCYFRIMETKTATDKQVIEAMARYGGGFITALSVACSKADKNNLEIIKNAFSGHWDHYSNMALNKKIF